LAKLQRNDLASWLKKGVVKTLIKIRLSDGLGQPFSDYPLMIWRFILPGLLKNVRLDLYSLPPCLLLDIGF